MQPRPPGLSPARSGPWPPRFASITEVAHNRPVPTTTALGFSHLISPMPLAKFFDTYFEKRHLHLPGKVPQRFASVLDIERVERVLWQQSSRLNEFVSVLQAGVRQMAPRTGAFKWAKDLFNSGASLVFDGIGSCDLEFAAFQQRVEAELGMEINTNVYLTPASHQTFSAHFDVHDTFVIHLHGTKRWRLHAQVAELPLRHHHRPLDPAKLGPVVAEVDLGPGHILYIPRGVPHWAVAAGEPSLHVTLGLYPVRYVDLLHNLVRLAADANPGLRAAVPRRQLASGDLDTLDAAVRKLASMARSPAFRRAAVDRSREHAVARSASLPDAGLVGTFATAAPLAITDWVERCPGLLSHVSSLGEKVRIAFGGYEPFPSSPEPASLQGPEFVRPVFEFVARSKAPFRVRDVPGELTDQSKLLLVNQLLSGGLVRRVAAPARSRRKSARRS
jgi:ribosomal protein L16 Arg81 hydroxylase